MSDILRDKTFELSLKGIKAADKLKESREYDLASQLLRASTSVGANVREANSAQSRKDFTAKLGIAHKECDETMYWLELLEMAGKYSDPEMYELARQVFAILTKSLKTLRSKE